MLRVLLQANYIVIINKEDFMFKTTEDRTIDIEEINWDSASKLLQNLHPNLVKVINNVSPDTSLTLYKASYPFATPVINRGNIQLPLAELANGLYFLSVASDQDGKRVALRKFVVSR